MFERLFREYGLPDRMRTDNGVPFASLALGRLSQLSVWWIRLGIRPELIEPRQPQQNGRHERLQRTLKAETTRPPAAHRRPQQRRFDTWRTEYNTERPHEALGQRAPAEPPLDATVSRQAAGAQVPESLRCAAGVDERRDPLE